jgi:hypothetical protein
MAIVGGVALVIVALVVLLAIVWIVMSLPDINRYRRLRKM